MILGDLLAAFERALRRRALSPNTIDAYHWALHDLIHKTMYPDFLMHAGDLTREVLEQWQDSAPSSQWTSLGLAGASEVWFRCEGHIALFVAGGEITAVAGGC